MSIYGALSTAISGLNAQAAAFSNISDNTANSQTVGYKGVETSFSDYLTTSTATQNQSGSVAARPNYLNEVQGTIQQSANPLALAIAGNGFFAVSEQAGATSGGTPIFSTQPTYSRAGDFTLDASGYLKNSAGEYLNGWSVDQATGTLDTSKLVPVQVSQTQFQPVATTAVSLIANVPATPSATSNLSSEVNIFDATGTTHKVVTTWAQTSPNNWTLSLSAADNQPAPALGSVAVAFNPNGTLASLGATTGTLAVNGTGRAASVAITPTFNGTPQTFSLALGTFGAPTGVTQFAGTNYSTSSITQNGAAPGSFTNISTTDAGAVQANYNNGQSVQIAQVPIITFADANALQRQNGQAFTATVQSGVAIAQDAKQNGAGGLVTGSTEGSNVDIATELSKLIVAQQAYGANAKVVTTANQMLTTTLDMKQ